jgi:DNA-binding transcriptional MerR regulator
LNKAPDAFRTISEVADELDLPQHVLRFWESRFPHIKPMKRGGGRRFYRPEDVDLLRGIRHLLYGDGYTIRGVQRILREQGVRIVQSVGQGRPVALPARDETAGAEPDGALGDPDLPPVPFSEAPQTLPSYRRRSPPTRSAQAGAGNLGAKGMGGGASAAAPAPAAPQQRSERERLDAALAFAPVLGPGSARADPGGLAPARLALADLDRLRAALAALEACSRLLDEAGRKVNGSERTLGPNSDQV